MQITPALLRNLVSGEVSQTVLEQIAAGLTNMKAIQTRLDKLFAERAKVVEEQKMVLKRFDSEITEIQAQCGHPAVTNSHVYGDRVAITCDICGKDLTPNEVRFT